MGFWRLCVIFYFCWFNLVVSRFAEQSLLNNSHIKDFRIAIAEATFSDYGFDAQSERTYPCELKKGQVLPSPDKVEMDDNSENRELRSEPSSKEVEKTELPFIFPF